MGKKSVHFRCHRCLRCCKDVVCLPTPWDVIRIVRQTGADPNVFLEFLTPDEVSGVAKSDPTWLECDGERYIMALQRGKRGCFFLDRKGGGCSIYDSRPILCRLFPFKLHETRSGAFKSFSLHDDVECPRHQDGTHDTGPLHELYLEDKKHQDDYNDLVAFFNDKKPAPVKPRDFLDTFIEVRTRRSFG